MSQKCILPTACPHHGGACRTLDECGAAYVMRQIEIGPYRVISWGSDNPTIRAMAKAGMVRVTETTNDGRATIVKKE